jgi:membrane protein implicated in regulation of membrane protease activity
VLYLYLASFFAGLLLAVRLMFFGAERRRIPSPDALPLRRWEPAMVAFLAMFGIAGYLVLRQTEIRDTAAIGTAGVIAAIFAAIVTRLAIATARIQPEHDPDDPRYVLQGRVGIVTVAIPADGEGTVRYQESAEGAETAVRAREISGGAIAAGQEVCIERVEDGVAHVELWDTVEQRL